VDEVDGPRVAQVMAWETEEPENNPDDREDGQGDDAS
jgi:hypothetical protein